MEIYIIINIEYKMAMYYQRKRTTRLGGRDMTQQTFRQTKANWTQMEDQDQLRAYEY